jgi:CheY-like chemotaxis protein
LNNNDKNKNGKVETDYNKVQILIVDDNFFCSVAVVNLLQQYQMESHLATDGQEAFELVKHRFETTGTTYRLIIMDVFMPICTGI